MLTRKTQQNISYSISDSQQKDRVESLYCSDDITLDDIIDVASEMDYEVDYCELEEYFDIWGWTEGVTEEHCQDWRISLYK